MAAGVWEVWQEHHTLHHAPLQAMNKHRNVHNRMCIFSLFGRSNLSRNNIKICCLSNVSLQIFSGLGPADRRRLWHSQGLGCVRLLQKQRHQPFGAGQHLRRAVEDHEPERRPGPLRVQPLRGHTQGRSVVIPVVCLFFCLEWLLNHPLVCFLGFISRTFIMRCIYS